jgi:TolA-binding protein
MPIKRNTLLAALTAAAIGLGAASVGHEAFADTAVGEHAAYEAAMAVALESGNIEALQAFLRRYPTSPLAPMALTTIAEMTGARTPSSFSSSVQPGSIY